MEVKHALSYTGLKRKQKSKSTRGSGGKQSRMDHDGDVDGIAYPEPGPNTQVGGNTVNALNPEGDIGVEFQKQYFKNFDRLYLDSKLPTAITTSMAKTAAAEWDTGFFVLRWLDAA